MFDVTTYLLTQNDPGGPIIKPLDPLPHERADFYEDSGEVTSSSPGRTIGGLVSLGLFLALGAYLYAAI
jgi:hypothetical protein